MELKEIAAISGKEGLYRVLKPARNGVIVETLDAQKKKIAVSAAGKVSILKEISIYTTTKEGSIALKDVFILMHQKYQGSLPLDSKADSADLMNFIAELLPEFDPEKVYPSDVKKLVKWYGILFSQAPEVLVEQEEKTEETQSEQKSEAKTEETQSEVKTKETAEEKPKKSEAKTTKKEEAKSEEKVEENTKEKPKKTKSKNTKTEETQPEAKKEENTENKSKKTRSKKES
ncbi:MAG: hypothetical protein OHK0045_19570 [Raineya sp.]